MDHRIWPAPRRQAAVRLIGAVGKYLVGDLEPVSWPADQFAARQPNSNSFGSKSFTALAIARARPLSVAAMLYSAHAVSRVRAAAQ